MKDCYLDDLLDRAANLRAYIHVARHAPFTWENRWPLLKRALEEARDISNILEREFCDAGIPI